MEFEFTWVDPTLLISRTRGVASVEGFEALYEALVSQPEFGTNVKVLSDHTNLDASAVTAADIERIAAIRERFAGASGMRSAVVVGPQSAVRYGLGRMFQAFAESQAGSVAVFATTEEALAWLQEDSDAGASA